MDEEKRKKESKCNTIQESPLRTFVHEGGKKKKNGGERKEEKEGKVVKQ